ncbi:hypothetical protein LEP1GSC012_3553 [Leptospira interrogans serovar Valbuzzi str. Valbuzzi]|nr:hypothetical protein LEP1GSC012_3553 [Leptospira interrogans serovar Valbuzzi str. Valbuzzi]
MNSTERAFYGSPFWAPKGTFFKCSDKNESFYLQKVCFSDREKFSTPPKNRENSTQRFPMGRVGNSAQRFPMGRVGNSAQRFPMGRVGNSAQRFPMGRVVGWELSFTEDFVVIPTIDLEIQLFVGKVMGRSAWWELSFTEDLL